MFSNFEKWPWHYRCPITHPRLTAFCSQQSLLSDEPLWLSSSILANLSYRSQYIGFHCWIGDLPTPLRRVFGVKVPWPREWGLPSFLESSTPDPTKRFLPGLMLPLPTLFLPTDGCFCPLGLLCCACRCRCCCLHPETQSTG